MAESGKRGASSKPNEDDGFAVAEERDNSSVYLQESDDESSPGKVYCLKLLIKHAKEMEENTLNCRVQCSFHFQAFWNFYNQTDCGRKMLEAILEKHHCHVSLAKDKPWQGLFVFQILDERFHKKSDVKQFVQAILDTVHQNAEQKLLLSKFTVDPRLHKDVLERVRQTKELDSVWIEFDGEQGHEMYMVYLLEHKMIVTQRISDIVNAIEECFKNHEELVCVDLMWQRVMIYFGYLQKVKTKFPNLIINLDESKNAFVLKGPRDEARTAADTVLELMGTAQNEIYEVSFVPDCDLSIFSHPEMCAYINNAIPKVPIFWILNHLTKKIHVFAKDPKQLQGIDMVIKACVQEMFYPVLKDNSISTHKTARYLEELKKQHTGRLVIHSSTAGLRVTTADDIHEIVDAAIQEIISRERGADQDASGPEKEDERDRPLFSETVPARTDGYQETNSLVSMKGMVTDREIKETILVANKDIFHKLVEKDLEEFKCKGKELRVIVREVETQTKVGFELEGSTEKEVADVFQFIKQRIELEEQQLHAQKGSGDKIGATASPEEGKIAGPNATRKTESNEISDKSCVLKLLITYVRSEGEEVEDDTFQYRVQCSFHFQAFWNFYNQTDCGRKMLEAILEKHHCHVSLAKNKPWQGLFVFQILDERFHKKSDVKQFVQAILDTIHQNAEQKLLLSKFTVDPRLHKDVLERVRQTKELDSVWIEFDGEQGHEMYMVYLLEHKMIVTQRISDIVNAIEECFKNHEELVCVDLMWQRVMIYFGYLQKVKTKFPNLIINLDESKNAFVLKGPRDEARTAADTVLELLGTAQHEISEVTFAPGCQLEIFTHPEMCAYINKSIPVVSVVWLLNHLTKKIHVFAKDPKQLQGIDKAIKGCVQEMFYPVSKDHSISTHKTARYLEELKKQHRGRLVIHSSAAGLRVTTADDIHEIVDAAIQEIISRERGADQDASGPEKEDERDRPLFSETVPARTDGYQETNSLVSMKGMVTDREIKETILVANKDIFHKLVEKDLEEFKCKGKELRVIVREVETQTKVGFELEGSTEKEVADVFQFIKQRIELEEQQLHAQKGSGDKIGATASPEEGKITGPNATRKTESNEISDKSCVLKLLITYVRSEGEEAEDDTFQYRVQCSFHFQALWNFYNQTNCGRKILEAILEKHHCHVSLAKDKPWQGLFVFQILDERFHKKSDVKQFVQVILDTVHQNAEQELLLSKFTVDPRLHKDVLERVRQTKELDSVWIEFDGEQGHEMYMVYLLEHKMIVTQRISDIVNAIKECFKNHEELVCVDLMWQRVMIYFGYLQKVKTKFPNLIINWDESKNAFVLKGPRDEARTAADTVLELLGTAQHEISEVTFAPGCQLEIFTHPEMCAYINKSIPKVAVVWLLNQITKKIHLFAKDPKQLQGIDKAIKGCVQEKFYSVSKDHSISTHKTARYLEDLKKQHRGRLVIHSSTAGLCVTTADDIHEIVDAAIQEIISRERGADQDASGPEKQNERDRPLFSETVPARTDGYQKTNSLVSMKGMVTDREIKVTISVAKKDIFHKLVEKDLEEFKCKGKDLHVIVREVETQTKVGFELEGSTEKEVADVFQFIKQRIELEEQQLHAQKDSGDKIGATASPEEGKIAGPNATGKTESNETSGGMENYGMHQIIWTYPSSEKVILLKDTSCEADVILIPEIDGGSSKTGSCRKDTEKRLRVPSWNRGEKKEKETLRQEIKKVLKEISSEAVKSVGICIDPIGDWDFKHYLKSFLYQIDQCYSGSAGICSFKRLVLFTSDQECYMKACSITQNLKDKISKLSVEPQEHKPTDPEEEEVPTGCFCEKLSEGIHPTGTESQLSSEKRVDGTLRESSTRDKENENIYKSPTIERLIYTENGACLVKISGGKTYALPFVFANKPQIIYSEGFYYIMHETVWYKLKQSCLDYLLLQNMQTKKHIKIYEHSESMHGMRKRNKKRTNSRHASRNECQESLDSQTIADSPSVAMEGITNSSVGTVQRDEGGIVTKSDKMAGERTEINRGKTYERDNEEKPVDETEDKSRTATTIFSEGNAVKGFEAEIDTNMDQTQNGDPVKRFKGEFSGGETNNISGDIDKTKEDKSQASKEKVIQSKRRSMSFRPLRKTGKTLKKVTLVEDFCEIEGIETDEDLGGTGSKSEGNVSNISSSSAAATETISGNTQVLKLLIKYIKKRGKNAKIYDSKHHVSCCMNFHLMWNFYMQTDCQRKMLDAILTNYHCKVSLSADDNFKESFIFQILNAKFKEESDVHHFVDGVLYSVYVCAQKSLFIGSIEIDPRIQEDVRERIKERKELDCAWIEFVGEDKPIKVYTVCCKDQQQFVMQIITELITDVTKSFNSHEEMVTADFMWQMVMTRFEYLKETGLKFPSTEIINDKNQNAFLLKGPRDEVKAAAGHLEELLKMAHEEVHEEVFSPGYQFEIFAFSEMCDYIDNSLPKLAIVWIPNNLTKTLHLFSKDPEQLKGIDKFIKGCIKEKLYPLSKDNSNLPSEKIHSIEELKKKHKGRIVINLLESPVGLLVTTADDIFGIVDAAMQTIISSEIGEIHPETYVPEKPDGRDGQPDCNSEFSATNSDVEKNNLSSDISDSGKNIARSLEVKDKSVFRKLLIEHMEKFNQIAKEHCVSIEVSETQSRVGFVLKGLEKEVRHVVEIIRSTVKQQMQLQQYIRDMDGAAEKIHKHTTLCPNAAGKPENSKMSDVVTEDETPIPPPRAKRMKSSATENAGLHEGVKDDTATLDDTPTENSIKVSSDSISSDYDKESDFVEVPEWQINDAAQRIVSHSSHQVVGQTLNVTLYHPPPTKPCYDNRVLVQELNSAVTEEILTNFLVTETGARVTEILYGEEAGRVVVTLSSCIDFDALGKACRETRIKSTFLQVARVTISNCILVWNLQLSASHELILLYFENKRRSGGGEVERVEMVPEERYCLVYFEDNTVIDRVLSQTHKIDGADVKVHLHHECLGRRSSTDRSHLCFKISNTGDKDTATLDDTPTENSIKVSSDSISSDYDKASDFVEVPDRQINDDTATLDDTSTENSMKETFSSTDISVDYDKASDFVEVAEWQLNDVKGGDQTTAISDLARRDSGKNHGKKPEKDIGEIYSKEKEQTKEKQNPAEPLWPEIEQKYFKKEKFFIYKPNNKIEVNIYMADITKLTGMQVITCSDDRRGNGYGAIASALLQTGNSKYTSIKKKAFQREVHFGDVIITEGGDSNFQLVVHAVLPFKDTISSERHKEMVHKCYDRILDEINKWQKTSLALPLLGAGYAELGYQGSAKLFLDSLEVFCNRTTKFNLKVIHIVDRDEHIIQKIADVFIKHTERVRNDLLAANGRELKQTLDLSSQASSVRPREEISQVKPKIPMSGEQSKEECLICLAEMISLKKLSCGHTFCIKCIEKQFRTKPVCPKCGTFHGTIYGDQPKGGKMSISIQKQSLPGFVKTDTLIIEYQIPSGTQGHNHPKPGMRYSGIIRTAYLPDTTEGRKVCDLLKVAFERRLIFKFSRSTTKGVDYILTWNDIHHKTKLSGKFGYPDPGYLKRVQHQLAAKGVTEADLEQGTLV